MNYLFVTVSDPHEDDACSHVPPADRPGAACLHLTRQSPDLTHPLNLLQSAVIPQADLLCSTQCSSCTLLHSCWTTVSRWYDCSFAQSRLQVTTT